MVKSVQKVLVSIIIPNYNHVTFLKQRLDSIFNQTFQNFEVMILDDASTDDSQKLLQDYSTHPKVSLLDFNKENSGSLYKQWVKGIKLAKGDYVWIAESDDFSSSEFLYNTVKVLENQTSLGMVFTDTNKVDVNGVSLGLVSESKKILKELIQKGCIIDNSNVTKYLLNKMVIVNASSVLFRKKALKETNFDVLEKFKNTGDIFTYLQLGINHKILFLNKPLNFMRLHGSNTTKKGKKSGRIYQDKLMVLCYYLPYLKKIEQTKSDVLSFFYGLFFFSLDNSLNKEVKHTLSKLLKYGYIEKQNFSVIKNIAFLYRVLTYKGKPTFVREQFKKVLKKRLSIN